VDPCSLGRGYKELAVSPGKLGITLQFVKEGGAVIRICHPACAFKDKVQIGDRIITIDGRHISKTEDLHVGKEGLRVFGIIPYSQDLHSRVCPPQQTLANANHHQSYAAAAAAGKRMRDERLNIQEVARKQTKTGNNASPYAMDSLGEAWRQRKGAQHKPIQHKPQAHTEKDLRDKEEFNRWLKDWNNYQKKDLTEYFRACHNDGWEFRTKQLLWYRQEHNDCNRVPLDYRDPDDLTLGE